jgi:hypothetical protein
MMQMEKNNYKSQKMNTYNLLTKFGRVSLEPKLSFNNHKENDLWEDHILA